MGSFLRIAGYMLLIALVIGTATSVAATERITTSLMLSGVVGWSFIPILQLLTGMLLVHGAGPSRWRHLEGYFSLHWPWSLWIVAYHATLLAFPGRSFGNLLALTGIIPMILTVRLLLRFSRVDLGLDRQAALRRVAGHQALTYGLFFAYASAAVALWSRVLKVVA